MQIRFVGDDGKQESKVKNKYKWTGTSVYFVLDWLNILDLFDWEIYRTNLQTTTVDPHAYWWTTLHTTQCFENIFPSFTFLTIQYSELLLF